MVKGWFWRMYRRSISFTVVPFFCALVLVLGVRRSVFAPSFRFWGSGNIRQNSFTKKSINSDFGSGYLSVGWGPSAPKSQRFLRFAIAMPMADPRNRQRFLRICRGGNWARPPPRGPPRKPLWRVCVFGPLSALMCRVLCDNMW